ncbi:MAG: aminoglycoside 6-adenylyltransferase [Anaerolineae bacterium]|nr:aminoglycoside 6-adenylyltransferase [Anaerolineae bacterium]
MSNLISNDRVIQHLLKWAEQRKSVRAVLLTSTRTIPGALLDPFSDYDVILAVTDIHPYFEDRGWLGDFGPVLVVYRDPIRVEHGCERFAYVTQYETDRLKIDFTVLQADWLRRVVELPGLPDELDVGYRMLLDKDTLTVGLHPPTFKAHIPTPPTEEAYLELIEVFFHDATYAAKHLWRGDLLPAKQSIDCVLKFKKIRQLLEWQMGIDTGWSIKAGAYGKGLKKYVRPEIWTDLEKTYVGADTEENWNALIETIDLFRRVAIMVGEHLGYAYPHDMDHRMMVYLHEVKTLARG